MKWTSMLLATVLLLVGGCGGDDDSTSAGEPAPKDEAAMEEEGAMEKGGGAKEEDEAMEKESAASGRGGTTITVGDSEFGEMLFDANEQAIYVFENDPKDETVCYDECAEAWPPVLTEGEPKAGQGVDESLLGTVERDDGELQVTYAGRPLYFYANEQAGEVRCHNVNLNGGFWWVVGPDGDPLA